MCSIAITLYPTIRVQPVEEPRGSMFRFKRHKWRLTDKSLDRIPTRWRLLIAGLIGGGTGLLILTMWAPGSKEDKSSVSNQSSVLTSEVKVAGRMTRINLSEREKSSNYCEIREGCSKVICSSIPETLDSGQVASDYMTRVFMIQCPGIDNVNILVFDSCAFPNETLERGWLNVSLKIFELTLSKCLISDISKGAFASSIFANLEILKIETTKIKKLNKWIFQELSNLKQLSIINNIIDEAEYDLLEPVADSLGILELDDCFTDPGVFLNITGESSLMRLQIASIQRNSIGTLSSKILKSIPNVQSLFLGDSRIEDCEVDAFESTPSLKLLDMTNNLLKNLPAGIFDSLLEKQYVRLSIQENPWECDCQFRWIQDTMKNHPSKFDQVPKCRTPKINSGLDFLNADFCNEKISTTTESFPRTTTIETTQNQQINNEELNFLSFTCRNLGSSESLPGRKLFSTEWKFPTSFENFYAKPFDDGTVLVNLNVLSDVSLIWFQSPEEENVTVTSINCIGNLRGPYLLENLERGRSYTICLLKELNEAPSPFDCLATRSESLPRNNTWLTYEDKAIVVSVSITMIIIVSIVSVLSSFLVIRRNPSLLRGSKRIVMVRNRNVEALVLPQGVAKDRNEVGDDPLQKRFPDDSVQKRFPNDPLKKRFPDDPVQKQFVDDSRDYLTPLEVGRCAGDSSPLCSGRKDSKASGVSSQYAGSYVSGIEPSPTELADWRSNVKPIIFGNFPEDDGLEKPPPLPHRFQRRVIPSLSLSVEALENESLNFRVDGRDTVDKKNLVKWID